MDHELKPLPSDTVRLIGSSQVITSVYSVVKELVENALDSDATVIDVKLENFGLDKVEVRDNGHGIRQENMPYVAKRYHTSKIAAFGDLESLSTYGFRGEALGSLCAVSSLAITSKTAEERVSVTCSFDHHGTIMSKQPSHLGQGTTITACNLFKNLPVRRQFYNTVKKKKEELKRIEDLLMAFGAIKPVVRLLLKNGKDTVWQKNSLSDTRTALLGILGRSVVSQMDHKHVTCENPKVVVDCYVPRPKSDVNGTSRSTNDRCFIAVNNRPVHVKEIEKMVKQFYCASMGVEGRYPMCYIALQVSTTNIDVNVDPNKTRVMLQEQKFILSQIHDLLEEFYGPLKNKKEGESYNDNSSEGSQMADISMDLNDSDLSVDVNDTGNTHRREVAGQTKTGHKVKCLYPNNLADKESDVGPGVKISFYGSTASNEEKYDNNQLGTVESGPHDKEGFDANKPFTEQADNLDVESNGLRIDPCTNMLDPGETIEKMESHSKCASEKIKESELKEILEITQEPDTSTQMNPGSFHIMDDTLDDLLKSQNDKNKDNSIEIDLDLDHDFLKACEFIEKENMRDKASSSDLDNLKDAGKDQASFKNLDNTLDISSRSDGALKWSIGKGAIGQNGSILQPVTLLAPNGSITSGKRSRSFTEMENDLDLAGFTPPMKRKSLTVQADQPRLYDVVGKSPKEKYSLGFIAFSKEERPKVLEEKPHLSYDDITRLVSQSWNKLSDFDKRGYEEEGKVQIDQLKKTVLEKQGAKTKTFRKVEQPTTIKEKLSSSTTKTKTVRVKFSIQRLQTLYQWDYKQSQSVLPSEMSLIGPLKFYNGWVCFHGNKVKVLNPHRVEETILFRELMENHVITSSKLESPIILNESILGQTLLDSLIELIPTDSYQTYTYIDDKRITSNGFQVRCHVDQNNCPVLELDAVSKCIPTFGVQDLKEVVELIKDTAATSLHQCRPLKVIYYLQGEAVRMVRQRPFMKTRDDVQEILNQMVDKLPTDCDQCLHEKPFLHTLYDMDSIPVSQATQA